MLKSLSSNASTKTPATVTPPIEESKDQYFLKTCLDFTKRKEIKIFDKKTKSLTGGIEILKYKRKAKKTKKSLKNKEVRLFDRRTEGKNEPPRARSFDENGSYFNSLSKRFINRAKKMKDIKEEVKGILKKKLIKIERLEEVKKIDIGSAKKREKKRVRFNLQENMVKEILTKKSEKFSIKSPHPTKQKIAFSQIPKISRKLFKSYSPNLQKKVPSTTQKILSKGIKGFESDYSNSQTKKKKKLMEKFWSLKANLKTSDSEKVRIKRKESPKNSISKNKVSIFKKKLNYKKKYSSRLFQKRNNDSSSYMSLFKKKKLLKF